MKANIGSDSVDGLFEPLTTSSGHFERCQNPLCDTPIEPLEGGWRRTAKRFCSDDCKMAGWILKRAGELLAGCADKEVLLIIRNHLPNAVKTDSSESKSHEEAETD